MQEYARRQLRDSALSLRAAVLTAAVVLVTPFVGISTGAAQSSVELMSENYTLVAPTLSGGGAIDLQSTAPDPTVSALGVTIGQSVVGVSTGPDTGIQLRAGFWHMIGDGTPPDTTDSDGDTVPDSQDNCPIHPNADQADLNGDDVGDVCECSGPDSIYGDVNTDGSVAGADYTIWADNFGAEAFGHSNGDFNCDDQINGADYTIWADNFGEMAP